jgi:hypothetical protein
MSSERKTKKGRYPKGTSGNPAGRPPGSRNRATLLMSALLEGEAQELTRKVIDLAKEGDTQALRLCLDRLMPPGKDRLVHFDLPTIRGLDDIQLGIMSIMAAISQGRLTPQEGELLSRILTEQAKIATTQDVERRLQKLEQAQPPNEYDITPVQN